MENVKVDNHIKKLPIAFNVNFDSLSFYCGFPERFRDPSYFEIFDRFLQIANNRKFKFSIYIIGQDLRNKEIAARVRDWSNQGHEIGNHTWSHRLDLGALPPLEIEREILLSHEAIYKVTGKEPKGFIAPGWSTSPVVYRILIENGYCYDTSHFPSMLFYAFILKAVLNNWKNLQQVKTILNRKDWFWPITKPIEPFWIDKTGSVCPKGDNAILILPMPTTSRFSFVVWHTIGFVLGLDYLKSKLVRLLETKECFYYLIHPMDLAGSEDLKNLIFTYTMERKQQSIERKIGILQEIVDLCIASGRNLVTVGQLAELYIAKYGSAQKS